MDIDAEKLLAHYRAIRETKQPKTERHAIIKMFVDRLNQGRVENGWKELSPQFYAVKMAQSGLKSKSDLYWFYGYCNDAKNFSSCWWWALRDSKHK